jgi:glycosyltransferase involved in cell wall biosynthesis
MANILLADDGIEFDGKTPEQGPLGGVESSVILLMQELAKRGHRVHVRNMCKDALEYKGVDWKPLNSGNWPNDIDLYIANRGDKLIKRMPSAKRTVFWTHNPASYLMKWRYLYKLWQVKPAIIYIGCYHETTYPDWAPGGDQVVIPYGLPDEFCQAVERETAPTPRAVFTSNALRSLDWLLDLWSRRIEPAVPGAELHLFTGAATYGSVGVDKADAMNAVIAQAETLSDQGVVIRGPVAKSQLVTEFAEARCMLYRGDINETFCLAVGEAQASGVPAVVRDLGSVVERVVDGKTGFVGKDDEQFVTAAINLLKDDDLWRRQHHEALKQQRSWRWPDAAAAFEDLILSG